MKQKTYKPLTFKGNGVISYAILKIKEGEIFMIFRLNKILVRRINNALSFRDYEANPYSRNKICLKTS